MQTWKPLTCNCKFEVLFPTPDKDEQTFVSLIKKGMEHKTVVEAADLYEICIRENRRLSAVLELALQIRPDEPDTQAPLVNDVLFTFEDSVPPRTMNIEILIFTEQEKIQLIRLVESRAIKNVFIKVKS